MHVRQKQVPHFMDLAATIHWSAILLQSFLGNVHQEGCGISDMLIDICCRFTLIIYMVIVYMMVIIVRNIRRRIIPFKINIQIPFLTTAPCESQSPLPWFDGSKIQWTTISAENMNEWNESKKVK